MSILETMPEGYQPRDENQKWALEEIERVWDRSDVIVLEAGVGCHAKGTEVLMYDGTLKKVEDVIVGDILMGPDSTPRTVKKLYRGRELMYRVTPKKGQSWVVNENHILSLEKTPKKKGDPIIVRNLKVNDFLKLGPGLQKDLKLYRRGVEYCEKAIRIDPYILGLWLGDGSSWQTTFTLSDVLLQKAVIDYVESVGLEYNLFDKPGCKEVRVTKGKNGNTLRDALNYYGIRGDKRIPKDYLTNSREIRYQVLAGILDTDGYVDKSGFEVICKSDGLAEDILYLARSLGLAAYRSDKWVRLKDWNTSRRYNRIYISGECLNIPTKLKRPKRNCPVSTLRTGFSLEPVGIGDFYGFNLDKDHLYLLSDFTVTHNSGKSFLLQTIAEWRQSKGESSATLTPRVTLQEQYKKSFPGVVMLQGQSRYKCQDTMFKSCQERIEVIGNSCSGCEYSKCKNEAKEAKNGIFSIHSYLTLRERKQVLLCDEMQSLYGIMQDQNTLMLWQHKVKYPDNLSEYGDVIQWLEKAIEMYEEEKQALDGTISTMQESGADTKELLPWVVGVNELSRTIDKFKRVLNGVRKAPTNYFIEHVMDTYRGKPAKALKIRPTTLEDSMGWLWPPSSTKKIVLASATVSEEDIKRLGLSHRRVSWVKVPESIKAEDRPIIIEHVGNMGFRFQDKTIPKMADKIEEIRLRHKGTKGIVHTTYAIAEKLKKSLKGSNYIWHTPKDKEKMLKEFLKAPPDTVFIACGMSEGIDLAGPEFGWQLISKCPWPNKTDKLIDSWYEHDFEWVAWLVARDIIQACGRVNRYPGDYAVTYFADVALGDPRKNRRGFMNQFKHMFSEDFLRRFI